MTNKPNTTAERDYPPLPSPTLLRRVMPDGFWYGDVHGYTAKQMRAYVDADRASRAQTPQSTYPGANVAERLESMADEQPAGSQAKSDLYAAATAWRKHIAPKAEAEPVQQPERVPLTLRQRDALAICTRSRKVSVSEVQRKLKCSYAQAQELCQSLVDYGGLVDGFELAPSLQPAHKEQA